MRPLSGRWHLRSRRPADPGLMLLRSVCHELRPPVSTLTSLVRAIEDQPSGARRAELAQLAAEHAAHAEAVLRQAAAAAYGLADPTEPALPLHRVLPAVTATVPAERLIVRIGGSSGARLVHSQRVRQLLINLLGNADRHGPPGGAIRLEIRNHGRGLRLTVADEGRLTPELALALRCRTPPSGEKGLGLWVVRQLVATHGGSVRARPLTPRGVAVEVTLPAHRR
jgi:signal transduction histidine kinase